MKKNNRTMRFLLAALAALSLSAFSAASASADFDVLSFEGGLFDAGGQKESRAGAHPHVGTTEFHLETALSEEGETIPAESMKFTHVEMPPGLIGNPQATPKCQ